MLFVAFIDLKSAHLYIILLTRNLWEEMLQVTMFRGEKLQDAEAVHKCLQDLTEALNHIEVKIVGNRWIGFLPIFGGGVILSINQNLVRSINMFFL